MTKVRIASSRFERFGPRTAQAYQIDVRLRTYSLVIFHVLAHSGRGGGGQPRRGVRHSGSCRMLLGHLAKGLPRPLAGIVVIGQSCDRLGCRIYIHIGHNSLTAPGIALHVFGQSA